VATTISAPALAGAVLALRKAGCVFAEDEAAMLGATADDEATLSALVRRRAAGEPLEQVVGFADFCGLRIRLRPGVFVPRVRSELLVRLAADHAKQVGDRNRNLGEAVPERDNGQAVWERDNGGVVVVDLCCGSGALGLAVLARTPRASLYATDVDPNAVACARDNRAGQVFQGDLFDALPDALAGTIDVLVANVPYVATRHIPLLPAEARDHEPHTALDGGADGLDVFRAVVAEAPRWLAPAGALFSEITEAQVDAATAALRAAGLLPEVTHDDDLEATVVTGRRQAIPRVDAAR
jgi:release factor glutamine methyltransferase